jgi:hypothetical protein
MPAKLLQIPESLRDDCEEIFKLTDAFCAENLGPNTASCAAS